MLANVSVNVVIPHSKSGDLTITLKAPNGLTTTLIISDLVAGGSGSLVSWQCIILEWARRS